MVMRDGSPACTHTLRGERCTKPGKSPIGWLAPHAANSATTDLATIERWWRDAGSRGLNFGLAMGHARVALDIDSYRGGEESLAEIVAITGALPDTVQLLSGGGGRHIIFADPVPGGIGQAPPRRPDGTAIRHIDIKSTGGYIVGPGSLHASGKFYVAEASSDPLEGVCPAELPESLLLLLRSASSAPLLDVSRTTERVLEGERKKTLVSLAGAMHLRGVPEDVVVRTCVEFDAASCEPPLGEREAARIAKTVTRKPRDGRRAAMPAADAAAPAIVPSTVATTDRASEPVPVARTNEEWQHITERVTADPNTLCAPDVLEAFVQLFANNRVDFAQRRSALQAIKGIRIRPFDAALRALRQERAGATQPTRPANDAGVPEIIVEPGEIERIADESLAALQGCGDIFQRAGMLVHVTHEPANSALVRRQANSPQIAALREARLRELLSRHARYLQSVERTVDGVKVSTLVRTDPPMGTVQTIFARPSWPVVPSLLAVVSVPVFCTDGSIMTSAGYNESTGIYYEPVGASPEVPTHPTLDDARRAAEELFEVVVDFPFAKPSHRAAWLAAILTILARYAFDGPSPLILIDKNVRGAGAGLLADTIALIGTGRVAARMAHTEDDEETRKRIMAIAIAADPVVLIDNIAGKLGSPSLDMALTATQISDRILGASEQRKMPLYVTWLATGNNVAMGADTTRRTMHIRLESPHENPEERNANDYRHPQLVTWVTENRIRLLGAALTILRAYVLAGHPDQKLGTWGSFEMWSALVRNAVVWVGQPDPAETRKELASRADDEGQLLEVFLAGWREIDPVGQGMTVAHVIELLEQDAAEASRDQRPRRFEKLREALAELLPAQMAGRPLSARAIGNRLKHWRGRVRGGWFLDSLEDRQRFSHWSVRQATTPGATSAESA